MLGYFLNLETFTLYFKFPYPCIFLKNLLNLLLIYYKLHLFGIV